jgi:signal transduction histidine kinase/CheY-like chemotaxis protein
MKISSGPAWIALTATLFLLLIVVALGKLEQARFQKDLYAEVVNQLSQVRSRLESEVNADLYLNRGLVSLVKAYPHFTEAEFKIIGKELLRGRTSVRNIGLAPDNILSHIFPIEGNEMAIGLVYRDNPDQWPPVERAMLSRKTVISGPLKLVEGNFAFISLTPIWINMPGSQEESYWGMANLVINADTLFTNVGIAHGKQLSIALAIRGVDGSGPEGAVFFGEASLFDQQPVTMEVFLPNGTWQLGAIPKGGWVQSSRLFDWLWIGGITASVAIGLLVWIWITAQSRQTQILMEAKQAAEKANRAKSELLSRMSHELRTPLNAILGFGQLLDLDMDASRSTDKQYLKHIMNSGHHLLSLINEVLDLARIDSGKFELKLEQISVPDVLDECLILVQPLANTHNIAVSIDHSGDKLFVWSDHKCLKQIILNLISNAIKYNRKDGCVTVAYRKTSDGRIRLSVTDTGAGIPKEKWGQLFQPFSRLGAENSQIEGTGIGLAISKNLVEAMNGSIGFKSTTEVGSEFWIELPQGFVHIEQPYMPEEKQAKVIAGMTTRKAKILYIEDNLFNQELMKGCMSLLFPDIQLFMETTAELGFATAEKELPQLILMDINLSGINGIEALRIIRKHDKLAKTPVIALSAAAMTKDIEKGMNAGFDAYITKPFDIQDIKQVIEKTLEQ